VRALRQLSRAGLDPIRADQCLTGRRRAGRRPPAAAALAIPSRPGQMRARRPPAGRAPRSGPDPRDPTPQRPATADNF
jgi:hypothetical protein